MKKRNRPEMPKWFNSEYAAFFRDNFTESQFLEYMQAVSGMQGTARANGINPADVKYFWFKSKPYTIFAKNNQIDAFLEWEREFIERIEQLAPVKKTPPKNGKYKDPSLLVFNPCDTHFGKLASGYGLEATKEKFYKGANGILSKAQLFDIEQIVFVGGNDMLHTDNTKRQTTGGTPQDTSGNWYDAFDLAFECYVDIITKFSDIAPVHYVHCMSNHDYQAGYMLSKALKAYFSNFDNVTFDVSAEHRKYVQYGVNLLGFSHGDGAKDSDLANLMKIEAKKAWSSCKFGYWYLGHLHHLIKKKNGKKIAEDCGDVLVMRNSGDSYTDSNIQYCHSLSYSDDWHKKQGYIGQPIAMDYFIVHAMQGQIAAMTEYIE